MKDPRIVRWDIADAAYEASTKAGLERKHFYGDLRNPRDIVQEKLKKLRYDDSPAGIMERYLNVVRGLLREK